MGSPLSPSRFFRSQPASAGSSRRASLIASARGSEELRGAAFGLRQALDTVGAFIGPLAAIGLMILTANSFTTVFWIAVIPAFISFSLITFVVEEPARRGPGARPPACAPPA